jgi:hypothetical protein
VYTCHPIATASICEARPFVSREVQSNAKPRICSAG